MEPGKSHGELEPGAGPQGWCSGLGRGMPEFMCPKPPEAHFSFFHVQPGTYLRDG